MNKKGFTLVEVIIAMAIVGVIAVTFIPLLTAQYVNISKTGDKSRATYKAVEEAEEEVGKLKNKEVTKNPTIQGDISIPDLGIDEKIDTVVIEKDEKGQKTEITTGVPKKPEKPPVDGKDDKDD